MLAGHIGRGWRRPRSTWSAWRIWMDWAGLASTCLSGAKRRSKQMAGRAGWTIVSSCSAGFEVQGWTQLFHTNGFGSTAGFLHPDPTLQASSLQFLEHMRRTAQATSSAWSLLAKKLLAGHCSQAPVVNYIWQQLEASGFTLSEKLMKELHCMWSGLLNSKLIEDGNKIQTEAEQRNSTSKELGRMEGWYGLSTHKLLSSYHRTEVACAQLYHMPASWDAHSLFSRAKKRRTGETTWEVDKEPGPDLFADISKVAPGNPTPMMASRGPWQTLTC